jgi:hypothetical protein
MYASLERPHKGKVSKSTEAVKSLAVGSGLEISDANGEEIPGRLSLDAELLLETEVGNPDAI